jgi:peptidoglycan hydrolase-like protein with peptidoglycan-binding domain
MVQPPQCKKVLVPAEYKVIKVKELVKDASCNKKPLPPKYDIVKKIVKVKDPEVIWDAILCNVNFKPMQIKQIQAKLKELGYYNGPISGELDDATMAAVVKFQVDHNLPAGQISIETLEKMGLKDLAQNYIKCEVKNLK